MKRKLFGGAAIGAVLVALLFGFSGPASAADETLPRSVAEWPLSTADVNRTAFVAARSIHSLAEFIFGLQTSTDRLEDARFLGYSFLVSGESDSFNLVTSGGFGMIKKSASGAEFFLPTATLSSSIFGLGEDGAGDGYTLTDWDENPGAGTYYVHISETLSTDKGVAWGTPSFTVGTEETVAGAYLISTVVVGGAETKSEDYSITDERSALSIGGAPPTEDFDVTDDDDAASNGTALGIKPSGVAGEAILVASFDTERDFVSISSLPIYHDDSVDFANGTSFAVTDDDSAASNGTALYVETLSQGTPETGRLWTASAGNATTYTESVSEAARLLVFDSDAASAIGSAVYFDEDASEAGVGYFYATTLSGNDVEVSFGGGMTIRIRYHADPSSVGVIAYYDDDAGAAAKILFVSPTDADSTIASGYGPAGLYFLEGEPGKLYYSPGSSPFDYQVATADGGILTIESTADPDALGAVKLYVDEGDLSFLFVSPTDADSTFETDLFLFDTYRPPLSEWVTLGD